MSSRLTLPPGPAQRRAPATQNADCSWPRPLLAAAWPRRGAMPQPCSPATPTKTWRQAAMSHQLRQPQPALCPPLPTAPRPPPPLAARRPTLGAASCGAAPASARGHSTRSNRSCSTQLLHPSITPQIQPPPGLEVRLDLVYLHVLYAACAVCDLICEGRAEVDVEQIDVPAMSCASSYAF